MTLSREAVGSWFGRRRAYDLVVRLMLYGCVLWQAPSKWHEFRDTHKIVGDEVEQEAHGDAANTAMLGLP